MPFASAQVNIADIPAYVKAQTKLTPIPKGPLNQAGAKRLTIALRRSEVNKARALRIAIANHRYNQQLYYQAPGSSNGLIWPGDYAPINVRRVNR